MEFTGECGLKFKVYQTASGSWATQDQKGCGITNESLMYVLEYLKEKHRCKI
jgi:hypothetical protein